MSDLISREEVIKLIQQYHGYMPNHINHEMYKKAKEIPTAYDVDKVVEQLEEMSGIQFDGQNESYQLDWCICTNKAIGIVKGGGQGE